MKNPVFVPVKQTQKEESPVQDLREILRESDEEARKFFERRDSRRSVPVSEERNNPKGPSEKTTP